MFFDYIDAILSFVAIWGAIKIAFITKKPLFPKFWKYFFPIYIGWDLIYNFLISFYLQLGQQLPDNTINFNTLIVSFLLILPEYYCLFLLANYKNRVANINKQL